MQTVLSKIWTQFTMSSSYDRNFNIEIYALAHTYSSTQVDDIFVI